jgi:hypothetical protein
VKIVEVEAVSITKVLVSATGATGQSSSTSNSEPPCKKMKTTGRPNKGNKQSDKELWDKLKNGEAVKRSEHQEKKFENFKTSKYRLNS